MLIKDCSEDQPELSNFLQINYSTVISKNVATVFQGPTRVGSFLSSSSSSFSSIVARSWSMYYTTSFVIALLFVLIMKTLVGLVCYYRCLHRRSRSADHDSRFRTWDNEGPIFPAPAVDKFLHEIAMEKPIRFTSRQLRLATDEFAYLLGAGAFGAVYKGLLSNNVLVAVKVLRGDSHKRIEEQFMAEVSTIGRVHHFNLVSLYGFCYEHGLRALVYEFMPNGSLDQFLFRGSGAAADWETRRKIAIGTAKGVAYLHEECKQRITHYDIKPGNVLLDANLSPKVSDFGLAKLCNRDMTHQSRTGWRGTRGYAAPEMSVPMPLTHKCDVYSYGILLFEVLGRRRQVDRGARGEDLAVEWFPLWMWRRFEQGEMGEAMAACGIGEGDREAAERMVAVALWCVQYRPESRPMMSEVVRMLEGGVGIPPPPNPFRHLMEYSPCAAVAPQSWMATSCNTDASAAVSTPVMRRFEIEMASS